MMTYEEAAKWLNDRGWRSDARDELSSADWFWWRRFREVQPNDFGNIDKPGIVISIYGWDSGRHGPNHHGCTFELKLRATPNDGVSVILEAYTLMNEELFDKLDAQCRKLIRAWVACQEPA